MFFSSQQLMETADYMYIIPPYRFTSYAIGIATGYFLRKARSLKISSTQFYLAWSITFTVLFFGFRFSADLCAENYEYNRSDAAFMTFLPIPFCAFFALVIITAEMKFSSEFPFKWQFFEMLTNIYRRSSDGNSWVERIQSHNETLLQFLSRAVCSLLL